MGLTMGKWKPKLKDRFDLQPFLLKKIPVFWIMGSICSGKRLLACMLEKCSKFHVIKVTDLIKDELAKGKLKAKIIDECMKRNKEVPDSIVVTLIKEYIYSNFVNAKGFMFCGFPVHLNQARLFENEICKVSLIIYCTVVLDCLLGRMIIKCGDINTEQVRKKFVHTSRKCKEIHKHYEYKTIKVMTNYPPENTCMKLVSDLEDYWGYKFERIYRKS